MHCNALRYGNVYELVCWVNYRSGWVCVKQKFINFGLTAFFLHTVACDTIVQKPETDLLQNKLTHCMLDAGYVGLDICEGKTTLNKRGEKMVTKLQNAQNFFEKLNFYCLYCLNYKKSKQKRYNALNVNNPYLLQ